MHEVHSWNLNTKHQHSIYRYNNLVIIIEYERLCQDAMTGKSIINGIP